MSINFYNKKILPYLVEKVCTGKYFMELRKKKVAALTGAGLELGSGTGLNFPYYNNDVKKLFIIEPCSVSTEKSQNALSKTPFPIEQIQYNQFGKIPLESSSLDFICSTWTLCTIPNVNEVLQEVSRLLKPNGEFHFLEHGLSPDRHIAFFQNLLNPLQKTFGGGCHLNRKIDQLIESNSLTISSMNKFYMPGIKIGTFLYSGLAYKTKESK